VQIPKFDAKPNPKSNANPSPNPNPMPIRFGQMTLRTSELLPLLLITLRIAYVTGYNSQLLATIIQQSRLGLL